jgi:L,D-peptidoglycan transpeptidase YkuD (ErfK/YbiS/YcfS/YnhG family)
MERPQLAGLIAHIVVRRRPGHPCQGLLTVGSKTYLCALGRGGVSSNKREGDGATPLGSMRLIGGYFRSDHVRLGSCALAMERIADHSGWCDDAKDANYNRPVRLPYKASHEVMKRKDGLYDVVIVLDYNLRPRQSGRGSAIFFHVAKPGLTPTEGCVALPAQTMKLLLPRLSRHTVMTVL